MLKVVFDTNFLLAQYQFNIDLFDKIKNMGNYELCIVEGTVKELEKLAGNGRSGMAARFALKMIKKFHILPQQEKLVDDELVRISSKDTIIATQDIELKKRILKKGFPVIIIRNKSYVELVNDVL